MLFCKLCIYLYNSNGFTPIQLLSAPRTILNTLNLHFIWCVRYAMTNRTLTYIFIACEFFNRFLWNLHFQCFECHQYSFIMLLRCGGIFRWVYVYILFLNANCLIYYHYLIPLFPLKYF